MKKICVAQLSYYSLDNFPRISNKVINVYKFILYLEYRSKTAITIVKDNICLVHTNLIIPINQVGNKFNLILQEYFHSQQIYIPTHLKTFHILSIFYNISSKITFVFPSLVRATTRNIVSISWDSLWVDMWYCWGEPGPETR